MEDLLQTSVVFQTYSVALNLMNKTLLLLAERGADQRTLTFMVQGINLLIEHVNKYASELSDEKNWSEELDKICQKYHIDRAGENPSEA
ncbi:hypothetical protein ISS30_01510 [bacterium]|nr:hypothetical protein [bacterium]